MSSAATHIESILTLDALTRMSPPRLAELYQTGSVPFLTALSGQPHGRMLALDGVRGPARGGIRRLAASTRFPWRGKAFSHVSQDRGDGINRIRLGADMTWYPFETSIAPSVVDGAPCLYLNYDLDKNPWFIRRIRDELREVSPGLYLGPALARVGNNHHRVLHFAVDNNTPAT